ncbi:probable ubiquitin carboxyl-terminal hydrolase MINDY-4 [Boleophthalmus pectinirostris]|uniref:probable ubiquitin carboxyl-terminal hydrolase MINDY-4 n=1 Tax=Boleophthalmus pectinirostris TaxID=150288 RepID=UPI00242DC281|nr:probable ubiquitin carboxyl-terminal hydrolase MINDY-4 [Boleophthalmus pectinirostris]
MCAPWLDGEHFVNMAISVAEVSSSLVREYLSRKGLKKTIACMDEEHPRTEASINNRSHLRQILHIEALYKRSKIENSPFKTLLEMIVKHMIEGSNEENTCSVSSPIELNNTENDMATSVLRSHIEITKPSQTTLLGPDKPERVPQNQSSLSAHDQRGQALMASHDTELFKSAGTESAKRNKTSRIRRGMMPGPIASIPEESVKKRQIRKTEIPQPLPTNEGKSGCGNSLLVSHFDQKTIKSTFFQNSCHDCFQGSYAPEGEQPILQMEKRVQSLAKLNLNVSELVLDDIDDEEMQSLSKMSLNRDITEQSWTSCPMDQRTAMELKDVLIGSSFNCFNVEWRNQGFTFSETDDLRYGIVQKKGGPCGVLASVQGFVLKKMLFGTSDPSNTLNKLRPSNSTRRKCLVLAIAEILWKAGEGKQATVAINSGTKHFIPVGQYKSEGVFERMILFTLDKRKDLEHFVDQHIEQFESEVMGCLLFVVSAVLSRSVDKVREDMDVPTTTLIGAHGYCTQELVNLLLWGQAVSNVFDNDMELDSGNGNITLLKGIKDHCEIGFLSLFEHYNICKVGSYLKTPHFPIWVVCSESHFSVLFGLQRELLISHQKGQEFDLYYYDGLSNQQEEIRLSVCVGGSTLSCMDDATELIPPLELCIRTRWKDAFVSWNDTEPIL